MNINYIAVHLLNDCSGSPRVLADFCSIEQIQSQSLTIVTSSKEGFLKTHLGKILFIWYPRSPWRPLNLLAFLFAQLQIFLVVIFLCYRSYRLGRRVVVINNTIYSLASLLASRLMGALTVTYVHELCGQRKLFKTVAERVVRFASDEILLVSKVLQENYHFEGCRSSLLPNGLRSDFSETYCLDYKKKFSEGSVLFVGSLRLYKGIFQLLVIARELPDIKFLAIFNCSEGELKRFLKTFTIPRNLSVKSRSLDLQKSYSEAFLLLNLSLSPQCREGFALTILEGMSAGCPCVVPPEGGHMDYFTDRAGIALDARDTNLIVRFLQHLKSDQSRWQSYSDTALAIAGQYSAEAYRKRANQLVAQMLNYHWAPDNEKS